MPTDVSPAALTAASTTPSTVDCAVNPAAIAWEPARRDRFDAWLATVVDAHGLRPATLRPASADASFRRYLRVDGAAGSFIVMDAPPPQEDVRPFVAVAALIEQAGLQAPRVLAQDVEHGFLLLTDLGNDLYLTALQHAQATGDDARIRSLMTDATAALVAWQQCVEAGGLPPYDDALLRRELALFPQWCVQRELGVAWTPEETQLWAEACDLLVASALAQPTVAVHRDWMPRNLMISQPNPGILDFQDAVRGPIGYDVASMLRDAFISWDEEQELDVAVRYWERARKASLPVPDDFGIFWQQVEWIGLQRHLKVLGIFCRLKHRDGKPKYAEDLPRFFAYAHKVAARYNALRPLSRLLEPLMGAERLDVFY